MLKLLSRIYSTAVLARNFAYDRGIIKVKKCGFPVISVGNLAAGGTGKTPAVIMIGKMLKKEGLLPAVVSRGYGRKSRGTFLFLPEDKPSPCQAGDEPVLIQRELGCPLCVSASRMEACALLKEKGIRPDAVILDDGFQHRKIHRDLNILLLDSKKPSAGGLLPSGRLREPFDGIKRADLVIFTRHTGLPDSSRVEMVKKTSPEARVFFASHETAGFFGIDGIEKKAPESASIFSAVASPDSFESSVRGQGIKIKNKLFLRDHSFLEGGVLKKLNDMLSEGPVVMTQKDAVKIPEKLSGSKNIYVLKIRFKIQNSSEFRNTVLEALNHSK
ncbi:MAG: tetraacyldisaccharide 4'-kinase [Fibrobacterota bacterium]